MQEEVTRKTIALAIKTAKLDGKVLQAALRKLLQLYDLTATVRAFKASQAMGRAAREPCGGETPLELRQQPSVLLFSLL